MTLTEIEALSREFCELAGICWHEADGALKNAETGSIKYRCCKCSKWFSFLPDFTDAREVLQVMEVRKDCALFFADLNNPLGNVYPMVDSGFINRNYVLDTTGLLLKEAVEWMRRKK